MTTPIPDSTLPAWAKAHTANLYTCGQCSHAIAEGESFRRLRSGLIRCASCMLREFHESPPATLAAAPVPGMDPSVKASIDARMESIRDMVRKFPDPRARRAGEDR